MEGLSTVELFDLIYALNRNPDTREGDELVRRPVAVYGPFLLALNRSGWKSR